MKKVLFVISQSGYQQYEYNEPKSILELESYIIDTASLEEWECISWDWSEITYAKYSLKSVNLNIYEAIVFVWWGWAYSDFMNNKDYYDLARNAKILWAICIAPTIISHSWVLEGKKVTGWDSWWDQKREIEANWGIYTWKSVEVDWNIVTANWPMAAVDFGNKLLELLNNNSN